jgi:hypothetical protein
MQTKFLKVVEDHLPSFEVGAALREPVLLVGDPKPFDRRIQMSIQVSDVVEYCLELRHFNSPVVLVGAAAQRTPSSDQRDEGAAGRSSESAAPSWWWALALPLARGVTLLWAA